MSRVLKVSYLSSDQAAGYCCGLVWNTMSLSATTGPGVAAKKKPVPGLDHMTSSYNTVRYNTSLLPSVSTIALGMFCGARYAHHTFTLIIKHDITTTANINLLGKRSFINKLHEKSDEHQAVHITYKTASL